MATGIQTNGHPAAGPAATGGPRSDRFLGTGWPRALWLGGAVLFVAMLVHIGVLVATGGPWTGPVSLRKPATFAETGWLVAWSVALILPTLRTRAWQRHVIGASTLLFGLGETAIMAVQAWRGVPSHYNFSTPFDAALMRGGAAGTAGIFLVGMVVLLVAAIRSDPAGPVLRLGVVAGVVVVLVACLIGLVMIFNNSGVYQGSVGADFIQRTGRGGYLGPDPATAGREYLLLPPFTAGGDLVLPHAIGVHGLILLAVPAVLAGRTALSVRRQRRLVGAAVAAVAVAMALLIGHALRALPLSQLPVPALVVLALCTVTLVAADATIAAAFVRTHPGTREKPGRET